MVYENTKGILNTAYGAVQEQNQDNLHSNKVEETAKTLVGEVQYGIKHNAQVSIDKKVEKMKYNNFSLKNVDTNVDTYLKQYIIEDLQRKQGKSKGGG